MSTVIGMYDVGTTDCGKKKTLKIHIYHEDGDPHALRPKPKGLYMGLTPATVEGRFSTWTQSRDVNEQGYVICLALYGRKNPHLMKKMIDVFEPYRDKIRDMFVAKEHIELRDFVKGHANRIVKL